MNNTNIDFKKPFESAQALMALQTAAITKTVELQKKAGEDLAAFFQTEAVKAQELKTPEDFIKFNVDSSKALFELMKTQGEAFTSLTKESGEEAMAEIQKMAS
jgi:hypothetical protein